MPIMRKQRKVESRTPFDISLAIIIGVLLAFAGLAIHSQQPQSDVPADAEAGISFAKGEEDIKTKEEPEPKQAKQSLVSKNSTIKVEQKATSGTCQDWMKSAGISDTASAYTLIMRESGCNPNAVNPSTGACGIGQQLPCGKWKHTWNDPVGAMKDMQTYVFSRYGSWANALAFHNSHGWY